jgi:phosphatidylinositol-3-phosphatase
MYFSDINSPKNPRLNKIVPFENSFSWDLASRTVPNFAWISPDQCHDMHGVSPATAVLIGLPAGDYPTTGLDHGAIHLGDNFVRKTVHQIMNSTTCKTTHSRIVLVWDENDYSGYAGAPGSTTGAKSVVPGGGDAPMIVINSTTTTQTTSAKLADHYTLLSTIEHMWHFGCLANTCSPGLRHLEQLFNRSHQRGSVRAAGGQPR